MNPFPMALPGPVGSVFALDEPWLQKGLEGSRQSPRKRIMLPLHRREESVQRMVNFIQPGSYIRPHCHPLPEQVECIAVIQGCLGLVEFSPGGEIRGHWRLEAGRPAGCLADMDAGVWHGMVSLAPDSVMLEIKKGPYNPLTDKKFPGWAPEENSAAAGEYLRKLESLFDG
jgi:cupin fold WbuC family metalloprotein